MRNLTQHEIDSLLIAGCVAEDWTQILVSENFSTSYISNVTFSGHIELGCFNCTFTLEDGVTQHSGLKNATLHNCKIADDVLIQNISNHIANYSIGERCYISNVNIITTLPNSTFGNGTLVNVLNETGGREVPIYNNLNSSLAYIIALYRHKSRALEHLIELINDYTKRQLSSTGEIGNDVKITNCRTIKNCKIGDYAQLENVSRVENGTINSDFENPTKIGDSVLAKDFIISTGSRITNSAKIIKCFVGQSCNISHGFSAHDSLIFSNCNFENGEACSIFAGPFTVSMHKSSLLIAGMFSFLNTGSGSNQSNHLYKLGPIHQGIVERGSKTTSDSYILWPSRIGMFSLIMGRHYRHSDTTKMPFSYIIEHSNQTYLIPGVNLRSVGTVRDAQKWPKRDKRRGSNFLDKINYNLLSPYAIEKMISGKEILTSLKEMSGETTQQYTYRNTQIKNSSLRNGIALYDKAITKFLGNSLISRIHLKSSLNSIEEIHSTLKPTSKSGKGQWVDLAGLIVPKSEIELILKRLEDNKINLNEIEDYFSLLHSDYYDMEWTWAYSAIEDYFNVNLSTITLDELKEIIERWESAVLYIDKELYKDAEKEFSITAMIGFGVDGTESEKSEDFTLVRGDFEQDPFVKAIKEHIKAKQQLKLETITLLDKVSH